VSTLLVTTAQHDVSQVKFSLLTGLPNYLTRCTSSLMQSFSLKLHYITLQLFLRVAISTRVLNHYYTRCTELRWKPKTRSEWLGKEMLSFRISPLSHILRKTRFIYLCVPKCAKYINMRMRVAQLTGWVRRIF